MHTHFGAVASLAVGQSVGVAGAESPRDYLFVRRGGSIWVVAYIVGLYALCCQIMPEATPHEFWRRAITTADPGGLVDALYIAK